MFERAIVLPETLPSPEGALRALDWGEIVARLAAIRDLREITRRPVLRGGRFVTLAASGIAGAEPGEPGVNLAGLSSSKRGNAKTAAAAFDADHGDQDN